MPDGQVTPAMVDQRRMALLAAMTDAELADVLENIDLRASFMMRGEHLVMASAIARLRRSGLTTEILPT